MLDNELFPRLVPVTTRGIITRLTDLRLEIESAAGALTEVELNAALFLNDICNFLGLTDTERRAVLGTDAAVFVDGLVTEPGLPRVAAGARQNR